MPAVLAYRHIDIIDKALLDEEIKCYLADFQISLLAGYPIGRKQSFRHNTISIGQIAFKPLPIGGCRFLIILYELIAILPEGFLQVKTIQIELLFDEQTQCFNPPGNGSRRLKLEAIPASIL
ncbi:MAG: hypothetical protein DDT26_02500 [Dehalococcoidia bacterium]|nr:hypothetical protein [Chloroflexota bacterium]